MLKCWTVLSDTPFNQKNTRFAQFLTSLDVLKDAATNAGLEFAPGLSEVIESATPPKLPFWKNLPTDVSLKRWGIYAIVMEKNGRKPRLYIGSGTSKLAGVKGRFKQYDDGFLVPEYVESSLEEGYSMTHKGLLCWLPSPKPADVPFCRLIMLVLEATFAYMFWAMKAKAGDYGMGHIRLWHHTSLEYDGLCSHCCLNEGITANFDLSPEELEEHAVEREKKRIMLKAENATNHHYKQMAENYDEYMTNANERVYRSRANNPGRDAAHQARRIQENFDNETYKCEPCGSVHGTQQRLDKHLKSSLHINKVAGVQPKKTPYKCNICNEYKAHQSSLNKHYKSEAHKEMAKKVAPPGKKQTTLSSMLD